MAGRDGFTKVPRRSRGIPTPQLEMPPAGSVKQPLPAPPFKYTKTAPAPYRLPSKQPAVKTPPRGRPPPPSESGSSIATTPSIDEPPPVFLFPPRTTTPTPTRSSRDSFVTLTSTPHSQAKPQQSSKQGDPAPPKAESDVVRMREQWKATEEERLENIRVDSIASLSRSGDDVAPLKRHGSAFFEVGRRLASTHPPRLFPPSARTKEVQCELISPTKLDEGPPRPGEAHPDLLRPITVTTESQGGLECDLPSSAPPPPPPP
eukprot:Sspe_Gene.89635::Locus_61360_Transcript_1_1_Confidence_1.000_Length_910::g.89635::m.89635